MLNTFIPNYNSSEIKQKLLCLDGDECFQTVCSLKPEPNDIIISTCSKTGTTVLQHICHLIRGGDMNFDYQFKISPFIEYLWNLGVELNTYPYGRPAIYKTHMPLSILFNLYGRECKYIVTLRKPEDTIRSLYSFLQKKKILNCDLDDFVASPLRKFHGSDMYSQFVENFKYKDLPNVLLIVYEDILKKPEEVIKKIATFMGVDNCDIDKIKEMSSKEYMLKNISKFGDEEFYKIMEMNGRLKHDDRIPADRVTNGEHHKTLVFSEVSKEIMKKRFEDIVTKELGYKNYEELVESVTSSS